MDSIIIIVLVICIIPQIIFILSLIPVYVMSVRDKKRHSPNPIYKEIIVEDRAKKNILEKIKSFITRYIRGYMRYFVIRVGMIPSHTIRNFIYQNILLIVIEENAIIYYGSEIREPYNLKIGKGSIIGDKSILDARNGIEIGENVNLSSNVHIWTEQHDHRDPYFQCNSNSTFKVKICNRAWIGPNVTILQGVLVGEGAVCAAGSVVTKEVEPFTIVAGIPAKKIGDRSKDLKYVFSGKPSAFY